MKLDGAALRLLCVAALFSGCMGQDSLQSRVRVTRVVDCVGGSDHQSCGFEAPCGTIQFALDKSLNGDRIEVMAGVCRGKGNFDLQFHGLGVELVGRASVEISGPAVQITCEGNGRAFKFQNSEDLRSTITGFVVRDCHADYGGAVWCSNSSPLFEHVVFRNNKASLAGGAIYWLTRGPVLRNCLFENNEAGAYGPDQASEFHTVYIPGGLPLLLYTFQVAMCWESYMVCVYIVCVCIHIHSHSTHSRISAAGLHTRRPFSRAWAARANARQLRPARYTHTHTHTQ
jgi:hypothetical protein